ncbi:hypothetical protein ScPMuIL_001708 [Solemya velum]
MQRYKTNYFSRACWLPRDDACIYFIRAFQTWFPPCITGSIRPNTVNQIHTSKMSDSAKKDTPDDKEKAADETPRKSSGLKPPAGFKPGSKPGSARSRTGSAPKSAKPAADKAKPAAKDWQTTKKTKDKFSTSSDTKSTKLALNMIQSYDTDEETRTSQIIITETPEINFTSTNPFNVLPLGEYSDISDDGQYFYCYCIQFFKQEYSGDEILVVYDYEFKFGQNFYIALTEEAKEKILHPPTKEGEEGEEGAAAEEEEDIVYTYIPPQAKEWVSHGSEKEISEEDVSETRPKIRVSVKRIRKEFGAPCNFEDRNAGDPKAGYVECQPYEDRTFDLKKVELDKGVQAIPGLQDCGTQTNWKYPKNANTQYYPREYDKLEKDKINTSKVLETFVTSVGPRFELALQQNEIMDVFYNDWLNLGDADDSFGSKSDNHLKEYQSFTDLQFSKEKRITCIDWHPNIKGIVAVAVAEKLAFDDRIDHGAKVIMTPSLILIWSFTDPIHPQILLEAPDDIYSFQFSPTDPNIIAGGCYNGQVVLWDISAHIDRLKQPRGGKASKTGNVLPGFEDESLLKTPIIRYCAVSSIENSHRAPITDILWLPDHLEVNRMGVPQENKSLQSCQIMTCASDYCILVWDTRPSKPTHGHKDEEKGLKNPMGVPNTFKHLDLSWKPLLKVTLHKSEPGGDHSPVKFSLAEQQGDRGALSKATDGIEKEPSATGGFYASGKPGSGKEKRTLQSVKTHLFVGTEDGEVVYADWMPQKDQDTGKIQTPKPDYYHSIHHGPVKAVERSPFFRDIVLCIGGWTFTIWKEGVSTGPILQSCANNVRLTAAHWSPSRPAVFYIAKVDGSVEVWDLLDKTHEPCLTQSVSPAPITTIHPFQVSQKQHLLAVGDNSGTLHILEIPWSLRHPTPNEISGMSNYFEREVKRRAFVVKRWDFRELEKRELEVENKKKVGIAPQVMLTDEEVEYRMKQEYTQYLEDEASFLRELGLKDDDEPLDEM